MSKDLNFLWYEGKLTKEDVKEYLKRNNREGFNDEELDHIANCCYDIYLFDKGKLPAVGHFLSAVLTNDLFEAVGRADSTNIRALRLYVMFLYNNAPMKSLWKMAERIKKEPYDWR